MIHRTRDTYSLSHFRQHTTEHLERLSEGRVETITRDGKAAMVVMSPEVYDAMRIELERGHLWDRAIARYEAGERGVDARQALERIATRSKSDS